MKLYEEVSLEAAGSERKKQTIPRHCRGDPTFLSISVLRGENYVETNIQRL